MRFSRVSHAFLTRFSALCRPLYTVLFRPTSRYAAPYTPCDVLYLRRRPSDADWCVRFDAVSDLRGPCRPVNLAESSSEIQCKWLKKQYKFVAAFFPSFFSDIPRTVLTIVTHDASSPYLP